ncbi:MAG: hypothetical protein KDB27_09980, partial [Planctomycetales bacterium]|nr:hypothetical protein [Planctomycetales bacterium]
MPGQHCRYTTKYVIPARTSLGRTRMVLIYEDFEMSHTSAPHVGVAKLGIQGAELIFGNPIGSLSGNAHSRRRKLWKLTRHVQFSVYCCR